MVRLAGLEPARPKAGDFKSPVATKLHHSRVNVYYTRVCDITQPLWRPYIVLHLSGTYLRIPCSRKILQVLHLPQGVIEFSVYTGWRQLQNMFCKVAGS